jgi:hypothetical protein
LVNENSSILSLLLLFSHIFSATVYVNSQLDLLCAGSTHLHRIRVDGLLGKRHTKLFLQVPKIEDNGKNGISKRIHSYTIRFICMEGEDDNASSRKRIIPVNHEHRERTNISHRKIQVSKMDEAFGTICSLISSELLFHISSYKTPNEAWTTMEGIFRKWDNMRGHMIKVELLTLDPKTFNNIQDFFTKYKDLLSRLKACGVDKSKEEKQMVLTILSKLGLEYSVFLSTFHSARFSSGSTWTVASLEAFIESLTQEKNKLIYMGKIKGPKAHALTVQDGSGHQYQKSKYKDKMKAHANTKKEGYSKPINDASGSKGGKGRKEEKCTYFHKGFHPESACMQN